MKPRDLLKDYNKETLRAWPEALLLGLLEKPSSLRIDYCRHSGESRNPFADVGE